MKKTEFRPTLKNKNKTKRSIRCSDSFIGNKFLRFSHAEISSNTKILLKLIFEQLKTG